MKQQKSLHKVLAENIGFVFVLPWLIGFLLFKVYPFASSLYYSFTNYDMFSGISKYGMMNYNKIFTDEDILRAFKVTFKYAIFDVPLKLAFALFIAYILNFKLKGVNFFRTAYYIPSILGGSIAIAILWRAVFNTDGLINTVITAFGLPKINWMASDNGALAVIVLLRVWQFGSAMVIFLAALKGVSQDLYEAASIDGATSTQQLFRITLPLLRPTTELVVLLQLIACFKVFGQIQLITGGGPAGSTKPLIQYIYETAFSKNNLGYAAAMSYVLFGILLVLSLAQLIMQKRGGDK